MPNLNRFLFYCGLMMLTCFLTSCNRGEQSMKKAVVEVTTVTPKKLQNHVISKAHIVIPYGYIPVKLNAIRTSDMGTVDHPTMDGGVINADDGLPVISEQSNNEVNMISSSPLKKMQPFEDSWARSKKVKSVLDKAAHEGKLNYIMAESAKEGFQQALHLFLLLKASTVTMRFRQKEQRVFGKSCLLLLTITTFKIKSVLISKNLLKLLWIILSNCIVNLAIGSLPLLPIMQVVSE